jgi:hypothetical protein
LFISWSLGVGRGHNRKNHLYIEKIFSRTSWPISLKLGENHFWVKRIKNILNEGPGSRPRGGNHKNADMG